MSVVIETTIGDITVDLYTKERPKACLNFLKLCKMKYYNFCLLYKVEKDFIVQTGDPTATGRGGESIFSFLYGDQAKYFEAELKPRMKHEKFGTLSMVNNGNNMNGSQFFLTLGENLSYLDEVHTVFGEVAEGFEVLLKINEIICDQNKRPYQDIRITHTVILHDPYDDPPGLEFPDASPEPTKEMLETDYIAPDEEIDDTKGKNVEEIEESIKESEDKARATILEMVGDIPDADVKPPENVLFVCKLNPVTTSEDLELIFSRFGTILSCEVIKDKKSGDSLQYAFIEFEKEEDCENAYFKMDNVLIDDRRIHVDFSQSVAKLNWNQRDKVDKGKPGRFQNFVLKSDTKKSDGYEMVFDTDEKSGPHKSGRFDGRNKRSYEKSYHSSRDLYKDKHVSKSYDNKAYSHANKQRSRYRHSKSPSPIEATSKTQSRSSRRETHLYHGKTNNSGAYDEMHKSSSRCGNYSPDSSYRKRKSISYEVPRSSNKDKTEKNDSNSKKSDYKRDFSKFSHRSYSKSPTPKKRRERSASLSDDGYSKHSKSKPKLRNRKERSASSSDDCYSNSQSSNNFKSKPQPQKRKERFDSLSDNDYSKSYNSTSSKSKPQKRRDRSASLSDDNYSKPRSSHNSKYNKQKMRKRSSSLSDYEYSKSHKSTNSKSKLSAKSKKSKKKQSSSSSDSSSSSSDESVSKKSSISAKGDKISKHSSRKKSPSPQHYKSSKRIITDTYKDKKFKNSKSKEFNSTSSDSDSKRRSKPSKEKTYHKHSKKSYS